MVINEFNTSILENEVRTINGDGTIEELSIQLRNVVVEEGIDEVG